jgi:uncharacterized protein YbjT (DUF2867 family)
MKKSNTRTVVSIEEHLKVAGFQTIKAVGEKHIHASGADDFDKSHAAFLQGAGKVSAFRMEACPEPILIVFRPAVEEPAAAPAEVNEPETLNPEPSTDN